VGVYVNGTVVTHSKLTFWFNICMKLQSWKFSA